jgi:hypothetical protein
MADDQRFQFSGEFVPANTPPDAVRRTTDAVAGELNNEVQRATSSGDADRPRQVRAGQFSGEVVPATLSPEDVKQTTDALARAIAGEVQGAPDQSQALHIRLGHSRVFSKTSNHKDVIHSKWGGAGEGKIPGMI